MITSDCRHTHVCDSLRCCRACMLQKFGWLIYCDNSLIPGREPRRSPVSPRCERLELPCKFPNACFLSQIFQLTISSGTFVSQTTKTNRSSWWDHLLIISNWLYANATNCKTVRHWTIWRVWWRTMKYEQMCENKVSTWVVKPII